MIGALINNAKTNCNANWYFWTSLVILVKMLEVDILSISIKDKLVVFINILCLIVSADNSDAFVPNQEPNNPNNKAHIALPSKKKVHNQKLYLLGLPDGFSCKIPKIVANILVCKPSNTPWHATKKIAARAKHLVNLVDCLNSLNII